MEEIDIADFERKFDIDNQTRQYCIKYIEEYKKNYPEEFKGSQDGKENWSFRKLPSCWGDYVGLPEVRAKLEVCKDGKPWAIYVACYNMEGKGWDDWMATPQSDSSQE